MASQSAIPLSAASMLSSWHLSAPPQAQQYPALPPTHGPQHLGQPAFGHPHPQPLVPYTAPNQLLPPIRQVFQDVDFDRKY
jgi:hypothetical protein